MILTVTINPLLERRFYFPQIDLSYVNRNGTVILKAGGKGINVNRQLNKFGLNNIALLFSGGNNGKLLRESLRHEKINFSDIPIKNETRDAAVIIDQSENKVYSFFKSDIKVSTSEVDNFVLKLGKMIPTCELVVFSGSSPCKETDIIFTEGIRIANKHDKVSICDTYGNHLKDCLDASPTIIHNNIDEIKASLDVKLDSEKENLLMLDSFYKKGIKQAFITNAENPFYASNFDFHYKVSLPKIDTVDSTGSGDAFTAGLIYGWHNRLKFEEQLRIASALGVCNAQSFEVCEIEIEKARQMFEDININPVGKKIKQINDMPG